MKISKKFAVPALVLGLIVLGGGTAMAAGNGFDVSKLTGFSDTQKTAIEQAFQIRKDADDKAKATLEAAGVDEKALRDQMHTQMEAKRTQIDAALDANDYAAFQTAVAGSPMADKVTADTFAKLVEIRKLDKAGDHAGAKKLRDELKAAGIGPMGMGGMGGHHDMHGPDSSNTPA